MCARLMGRQPNIKWALLDLSFKKSSRNIKGCNVSIARGELFSVCQEFHGYHFFNIGNVCICISSWVWVHLTLNVVVTGFNPIQTLSAHVIKGTFLLVFYSLKMVIMANLDGHQGTTIPPPHLSIGVILSGNKRNRHRQKVVLGHIFPRAKVTLI